MRADIMEAKGTGAFICDNLGRGTCAWIFDYPHSFHKSHVQCSKPAPALMQNLRLLTIDHLSRSIYAERLYPCGLQPKLNWVLLQESSDWAALCIDGLLSLFLRYTMSLDYITIERIEAGNCILLDHRS